MTMLLARLSFCPPFCRNDNNKTEQHHHYDLPSHLSKRRHTRHYHIHPLTTTTTLYLIMTLPKSRFPFLTFRFASTPLHWATIPVVPMAHRCRWDGTIPMPALRLYRSILVRNAVPCQNCSCPMPNGGLFCCGRDIPNSSCNKPWKKYRLFDKNGD